MPAERPRLLEELEEAWARTDRLFGVLTADAWAQRPIAARGPLVFHLGHTSALAWSQIGCGVLGREPWDGRLDALLEQPIDRTGEEPDADSLGDWPSVATIARYRDDVRDALRAAWDDVGERANEHVLAERHRVYALVLEYEQMHQEVVAGLIHALEPQYLERPAGADLDVGPAAAGGTVGIPQGRVTLGADFDELEFGWDNEFPRQRVDVDEFDLDRRPVTIAEYRAFVEAGGYRESSYWRADDWTWIQARDRRAPETWFSADGAWRCRTTFVDVDLAEVLGWPAVVTCAEAEAYARWQGARLPSEVELQRAAYGTPAGRERRFPWGSDPADEARANLDLTHWDLVPAGSRPAGTSAFGALDLVGNGWEWTSTEFGPLPGFEAWMPTWPTYSTDAFDADRRVAFGAAWPTATRLTRPSFRQRFRRRDPAVFATFRLVRA